jgi:polyhydroxyalkanoate synthase subunit PhaC
VLKVYAKEDHIVPPPTSRALGKFVGTQDYSELQLPGGHVGMFVSGKSQGIVGKTLVDWLKKRQ